MSQTVLERDAVTIRDCVSIHAYGYSHDARGRRITAPRTYSTNRARPAGAEVWSYGSHFPLYRYVRGDRRHAPLFVINGDRWPGGGWSSRTSDHQEITRRAIADSGVDSCVIPFNALAGAGIVLDSIRLINARPDANWTEDRSAETLAGVPRWMRTVSYSVERTAETLDAMPAGERRTWRELTPEESAHGLNVHGYPHNGASYAYADRLPDADGLYRWRESRTRPLAPAEDGRYHWTVNVHRLGDCLFSAVRDIPESARPADPFEGNRDNARERVELSDPNGRQWCEPNAGEHESGPSGACIHCGAPLTARGIWRRRARYLSSFDTNESPPLYFLAEVPRGAGETVETALDALAPAVVHGAYARGTEVERQGDIFLISTGVTDADLERRGIRSRARLTQWTRGARARKGETGYSAPLTAGDRRELTARARRIYLRERRAFALRDDLRPRTDAGARRRFRLIRADYARDLELSRGRLLRAMFRTDRLPFARAGERQRFSRAYGVRMERESFERIRARGAVDSWGNRSPAMARDAYRRNGRGIYGTVARDQWANALRRAHEDMRPELYGDRAARLRERVRDAVSIYGTAHSATEVVTLRSGAVYVRGTVRHVPELERGRFGRPDHSPVVLGNGARWYLAVRNTVPRQTSERRRRRRARQGSAV